LRDENAGNTAGFCVKIGIHFIINPTLSRLHIKRWVRIPGNKVNVVKVLVSMPAVYVFSSSALTLCFGLGGEDHTFDGRAFYVLLDKIQVWV